MDRAEFIRRRKGKYMAQILESFEKVIEPHLNGGANGDVQDFKGLVRARLNSLQADCVEMFELGDGAINDLTQEIRDRMSPVGRP